MSDHQPRRYWKSFQQRDGLKAFLDSVRDEFPEPLDTSPASVSRRGFLKAAGFSLAGAAITGCSRAPVEKAIPYLVPVEDVTPGRAYFYASTCAACSAGCGLLVKNRDGRPVKLEGNPDHPVSRGGLCAAGQASILGLYDQQRLTSPLRNGQPATWADVDAAVGGKLQEVRAPGG